MILGEATLFGVVQGLTEFLPISSSGHLLLLHSITHFSIGDDLSFDVALHLGTLVALLAYFWSDLWRLGRAWLGSFRRWHWADPDQRLAWLLVIATIPGAVTGDLLEKTADTTFRSPVLVATTLLVAGLWLWAVDRWSRAEKTMDQLGWRGAVMIGLGQMLAIVPGVSRSGATIAVGRWLRLDRTVAARFSFLLSTPIIAGAAAKKLLNLRAEHLSSDQQLAFVVGALSAAVVGYLVIRVLLRYISHHSYAVFAWYRLAVAATVYLVVWIR